MADFKGDDRAADGIPVEVKLDNGGYFEAFLMDIINGEALIHFPCHWMPEGKYKFSHVRFPPAEDTARSELQEKMIAEVLINKNNGCYQGWFKCCIKMLKSEFCQFEYLGTQNGSDFGHTSNMRKLNMNPQISMDMLHVHTIMIPENIREYAKCEDVHRPLKDAIKSALVNYNADRGELVIISRNIADISRARVLEKAHLSSLSQKTRVLQITGKLNRKLEIAKSSGFTEEFTVPENLLGFAIGKEKINLRTAKNIKGISIVQLVRVSNKFIIHGETEEAVKEARELLEIKIEAYPVLKEHMSQLVGRDSENIHKIVQATGALEIQIENIKNAVESEMQDNVLPLYITGTSRAIEKAKLFVRFQIDHIYEVQRLREKKIEINKKIADFLRNGTTPESDSLSSQTNLTDHDSETVQSTQQSVSSTNLCNYNMDELEELENLNELLYEDYEGAVNLDAIIEKSVTKDINLGDTNQGDTDQEDIAVEDTNQGDIDVEDTNQKNIDVEDTNQENIDVEDTNQEDIDVEDTNEEDNDLGYHTRRLDVSLESDTESSKILDTTTAITKTDNQSGIYYGMRSISDGYYIMDKPKEEEKVVSGGFQFVEDPDFWTTDNVDLKTSDIDNTPSEPLLEAQDTTYRKQVAEEIDDVIAEAITKQIRDLNEIQELHPQDDNVHSKDSSSIPKLCNDMENLQLEEPIIATNSLQLENQIYKSTQIALPQSYIQKTDDVSADLTFESNPEMVSNDVAAQSYIQNETMESTSVSQKTSEIAKSVEIDTTEKSFSTFNEIECTPVSTETSGIADSEENDTIETLCPTLIVVESRYTFKETSEIENNAGNSEIGSKPTASPEICNTELAIKKRNTTGKIPVKTKKIKNSSTETATKNVEGKATKVTPLKSTEIESKTSPSKIVVSAITTKKPIATPRLSLLKKSKKLINVSTATDDIASVPSNISETSSPVITETENKNSVSADSVPTAKKSETPRKIPVKRPVLKSHKNTETGAKNTATPPPVVIKKGSQTTLTSKTSHVPIATKSCDATQTIVKSKKLKIISIKTCGITKRAQNNTAGSLPSLIVGKENKTPASSKVVKAVTTTKKRILTPSHIAVKSKKIKCNSTEKTVIKSEEENTTGTSPLVIVEMDDKTAVSSEMCCVVPMLNKAQDDAEYLASLITATKKTNSEVKEEDNVDCSPIAQEEKTSVTVTDIVPILNVCTITNNAEEQPDMEALQMSSPDDSNTISETNKNVSELEDSELHSPSSSQDKSISSKSETSSTCDSDISSKTATTVISGNQTERLELQCDDKERNNSLQVEDEPNDLDSTDASEDTDFEEDATPSKDNKRTSEKPKQFSFTHLFKRIGYRGPLLDEMRFKAATREGLTNLDYNYLVVYLSKELHSLGKIHKRITRMTTASHWDIFSEELVGFMREIKCPYKDLTCVDVSERFRKTKQRRLVIKFLISELLCNQLLHNLNQLNELETSMNKNYVVCNRNSVSALLSLPVFPTDATVLALVKKFNRGADISSNT